MKEKRSCHSAEEVQCEICLENDPRLPPPSRRQSQRRATRHSVYKSKKVPTQFPLNWFHLGNKPRHQISTLSTLDLNTWPPQLQADVWFGKGYWLPLNGQTHYITRQWGRGGGGGGDRCVTPIVCGERLLTAGSTDGSVARMHRAACQGESSAST